MRSKINITSKNFLRVLLLCLFHSIVLLSFSQQRSTTSHISDKGWHTIKITDDKEDLEIKYIGDINFNEDETAIKSMSPDASLIYKKDGTAIKVTSDANGQIFYEVNGGVRKNQLDKEESALITTAIQTMISFGIGAKDRVDRIYKKAGSRGVLNEVVKMKSDHVKSIYMNYLLETSSLSADEMTIIANNVKELISSDYEKGKLLSKFSEKYIANPATAKAYLAAVKSISSDYEKSKALKVIFKQPLTGAQFTEILAVVNNISSDYEKARLLKEVLNNNKISGSQISEVLKTTASISSDYEKANLLKSILQNSKLPESQFIDALAVAESIRSSYEKANILKQLAASGISSETQWIGLINSAEKILSDHEKANVLITIATHMQLTENVKGAYSRAAKTISSDHEYGRTLRAVK